MFLEVDMATVMGTDTARFKKGGAVNKEKPKYK